MGVGSYELCLGGGNNESVVSYAVCGLPTNTDVAVPSPRLSELSCLKLLLDFQVTVLNVVGKSDLGHSMEIRMNLGAVFQNERNALFAQPSDKPSDFVNNIRSGLTVCFPGLGDLIIRREQREGEGARAGLILKFIRKRSAHSRFGEHSYGVEAESAPEQPFQAARVQLVVPVNDEDIFR
jgi:hypothetical protein